MMSVEEENFERNTAIWLNWKFSGASLEEIGEAFGLCAERVRQIGSKRDRQVKTRVLYLGKYPFVTPSEDARKILDTLYGIEISHEVTQWLEYRIVMRLDDPEKIRSLVPCSGKRAKSYTRYKGTEYWTSVPANAEEQG